MVVVTGLGRSGTSLMIEYVAKLGLSTNHGMWYEKFRAGNEDKNAVEINASFLKHYHQERPLHHVNFHADKIKALEQQVVKDPQFVAIPDIIEHWWNARKDIQIIYCWRKHEEIEKSQLAVPTMKSPVYRCFTRMMIPIEAAFMLRIRELNIPHIMVDYNDPNPKGVRDKLQEWGYDVTPNWEARWKKLWSPR